MPRPRFIGERVALTSSEMLFWPSVKPGLMALIWPVTLILPAPAYVTTPLPMLMLPPIFSVPESDWTVAALDRVTGPAMLLAPPRLSMAPLPPGPAPAMLTGTDAPIDNPPAAGIC